MISSAKLTKFWRLENMLRDTVDTMADIVAVDIVRGKLSVVGINICTSNYQEIETEIWWIMWYCFESNFYGQIFEKF